MHVTKYLKMLKNVIHNGNYVNIRHKYNTLTITDGLTYFVEINYNEAPEFSYGVFNEFSLADGIFGDYLFTTLEKLDLNLPTRVLPDDENQSLIFDQGEVKHVLKGSSHQLHFPNFFEESYITDNFELEGEALTEFKVFLANRKSERVEFETTADYDRTNLWYFKFRLALSDGENTLKIKPSDVLNGGRKSVVTGENVRKLLKLCQCDITSLDVDTKMVENGNLWRVIGNCKGDRQDYDARFMINFADV